MPRVLAPAPPAILDPKTGALAFGSFAGPLPPVVVPRLGTLDRALRRKRWVYVAIASERVWIALAVVHTGYATTAFAFAFDRREGKMIADATVLGTPLAASVGDDPHRAGTLARFASGGTTIAMNRDGEGLVLDARIGGLVLEATIDDRDAPPAITAIADLGGGRFDATEKRALAQVRGRLRHDGGEISLDGATAGYDYTYGLLPRHTQWRWAFALGRDEDGEPLAFNLVQGFVGEAECAAFTEDGVHPLGEARFELDVEAPEKPWRLTGEGIDLAFAVGAVHAQRTNLGLVRSRFLQPVGAFTGTLRVAGRDRRVANLPGVVEDQDVLW